MKLCLRCNQYFEDGIELCPIDTSHLESVGDHPLIGALINDRYVVESVIGKGSSGIVYKATRLLMGREVAVKVLHSYLGAESGALDRFLREARAASRLRHPHIINIWESGVTDDAQPYFVMDYLEGMTLADLIHEKGYIHAGRALPIITQVCEALAEAHKQGIVHRDIKPENIVLQANEGDNNFDDYVKVLDFGIADQTTALPGQIRQRTAAGSPAYMSPEQCQGFELDQRSDIYSLAIVIFELLTGSRPFIADDVMKLFYMHVQQPPPSLSSIRADLKFSPSVEAAIAKALSKKPNLRQQTIKEFQKGVEDAFNNIDPQLAVAAKRTESVPVDLFSVPVSDRLMDNLKTGTHNFIPGPQDWSEPDSSSTPVYASTAPGTMPKADSPDVSAAVGRLLKSARRASEALKLDNNDVPDWTAAQRNEGAAAGGSPATPTPTSGSGQFDKPEVTNWAEKVRKRSPGDSSSQELATYPARDQSESASGYPSGQLGGSQSEMPRNPNSPATSSAPGAPPLAESRETAPEKFGRITKPSDFLKAKSAEARQGSAQTNDVMGASTAPNVVSNNQSPGMQAREPVENSDQNEPAAPRREGFLRSSRPATKEEFATPSGQNRSVEVPPADSPEPASEESSVQRGGFLRSSRPVPPKPDEQMRSTGTTSGEAKAPVTPRAEESMPLEEKNKSKLEEGKFDTPQGEPVKAKPALPQTKNEAVTPAATGKPSAPTPAPPSPAANAIPPLPKPNIPAPKPAGPTPSIVDAASRLLSSLKKDVPTASKADQARKELQNKGGMPTEPTVTKPEPKLEPAAAKLESTPTKPEPTPTKPQPIPTKPEPIPTKPEPTPAKPELRKEPSAAPPDFARKDFPGKTEILKPSSPSTSAAAAPAAADAIKKAQPGMEAISAYEKQTGASFGKPPLPASKNQSDPPGKSEFSTQPSFLHQKPPDQPRQELEAKNPFAQEVDKRLPSEKEIVQSQETARPYLDPARFEQPVNKKAESLNKFSEAIEVLLDNAIMPKSAEHMRRSLNKIKKFEEEGAAGATSPEIPVLPPSVQPPSVQPASVQPPSVQPPSVQPPSVQPAKDFAGDTKSGVVREAFDSAALDAIPGVGDRKPEPEKPPADKSRFDKPINRGQLGVSGENVPVAKPKTFSIEETGRIDLKNFDQANKIPASVNPLAEAIDNALDSAMIKREPPSFMQFKRNEPAPPVPPAQQPAPPTVSPEPALLTPEPQAFVGSAPQQPATPSKPVAGPAEPERAVDAVSRLIEAAKKAPEASGAAKPEAYNRKVEEIRKKIEALKVADANKPVGGLPPDQASSSIPPYAEAPYVAPPNRQPSFAPAAQDPNALSDAVNRLLEAAQRQESANFNTPVPQTEQMNSYNNAPSLSSSSQATTGSAANRFGSSPNPFDPGASTAMNVTPFGQMADKVSQPDNRQEPPKKPSESSPMKSFTNMPNEQTVRAAELINAVRAKKGGDEPAPDYYSGYVNEAKANKGGSKREGRQSMRKGFQKGLKPPFWLLCLIGLAVLAFTIAYVKNWGPFEKTGAPMTVDGAIKANRPEKARELLEARKKAGSLTQADAEKLNDVYVKCATKLAADGDYAEAIKLLKLVPSRSKSFESARKLMKEYRHSSQ